MKKLDITFLSRSQIFPTWDDNHYNYQDNRLEIIKKYGSKAAITDYSILLGGPIGYDQRANVYFTPAFNYKTTLDGRTGYYYTKTLYNSRLWYISPTGEPYTNSLSVRLSARLVIPKDEIKERIIKTSNPDIVFFGEYPQMIENEENSKSLEIMYNYDKLLFTGKKYTYNFRTKNLNYVHRKLKEYIVSNKSKYIRIVANNEEDTLLSDGRRIEINKPYWVKVEPIEWYLDQNSGLLISKKLLFSKISFDEATEYIDKYFSKEIIPSKPKIIIKTISNNPYNFTLDSVSEEEIISGSIESDIPVFLHGPSS